MAAISGALGGITNTTTDGQTGLITRWTASIDREVHDITNFDDSTTNARTKLGGMYDLKGTCEGTVNGAAMPALLDVKTPDSTGKASMILTSSAGHTYTFTAITSNLSLDVPKAGVQTFTLSFESSGAVEVA